MKTKWEVRKPSFGGLGGPDGLAVLLPEILTYILFRSTLGRVMGIKGDRRKEIEKQPHRRTSNRKFQVLPGLSN